MWEAFLLGSCLVLQLTTFAIIAWAILPYIRARRMVYNILKLVSLKLKTKNMDLDNLINELMEPDATLETYEKPGSTTETVDMTKKIMAASTKQQHRERLAALANGGQARHYLGKTLTADQIDSMDEDELEKLYARYEARLGAAMTKTLGQAALHLYARAATMLLPIPPENQPALVADLEDDPFVEHALSSAACAIYHRWGMFLAPLTAAITTAKHCQFRHQCPLTIPDDGEDGNREQKGAREPKGGRQSTGGRANGGKSNSSTAGDQ